MIKSETQARNKRSIQHLRLGWIYHTRSILAIAAITIGTGIVGCGDSTGIPALSPDPFLNVTLNVRSATISTVAPYNTLQLVVTPRSASGQILSDSIETTFFTEDAKLVVSPSGLVTAKEMTPRTWVAAIVRDMRRNVTHTDTVFIAVTDVTPSSPLATFAIQRPPNDSAKIGVYNGSMGLFADTIVVAATALDGTDVTSDILVRFFVSDSSIAIVDPDFGIVKGLRPGAVTVFATTTYYGVTKTDSFRLAIGNPIIVSVSAEIRASPTVAGQYVREFVPSTITIGVGGTVFFGQAISFSGPYLPMDVVFEDPSTALPSPIPAELLTYPNGSGNIGPIPSLLLDGELNPACVLDMSFCQGAFRSFSAPGTYRYHSALYGTKGVIVVQGP